jgi:molybdopterin-containing oxidoreductase family iron-sulfur binding subunit
MQPLIAPLYDGKSEHELLAAIEGDRSSSGHEILRKAWSERLRLPLDAAPFEQSWKRALHDGRAAEAPQGLILVAGWRFGTPGAPARGIEIAFRPDASVFDGRFANNAWLQEAPRPLTKLVWDNAALLSERTAEELGAANGDVLEITVDSRSVKIPAWIVPGHPDGTITLHLGYGRTRAGRIGNGVGVDVYPLRTTKNPWNAVASSVRVTGERRELVSVQDHAQMEGRDIVRVASFDRFKKEPASEIWPKHGPKDPNALSLYPDQPYDGYAWGMVIDLNACIGCNACLVACQSENNIPIVGKDEVANGRELHWIRVDRYYASEEELVRGHAGATHKHENASAGEPIVLHQPVPCMHCERAPCEVVCPVGATVHSDEGLNEMIYNRCVGTRYCANNCPYKVRRFNFYPYSDYETEVSKLGNNPDVTVRSRGVMEKCTYCVQRINAARIQAKKEGRAIQDGEVVTACQSACPTQAISFGDINDPASAVSKLRAEPHHYSLLEELGTKPRTTYLAKLRNPNPALEGGSPK